MNKKYIYEIQAFAYSDFEHWILTHEKRYTKKEFLKIVEKARSEIKMDRDAFLHKTSTCYPYDLINKLTTEYGFKHSDHPIVDVGCYGSDKLTLEDC
jgi:hypothetical protein